MTGEEGGGAPGGVSPADATATPVAPGTWVGGERAITASLIDSMTSGAVMMARSP